MINPLEIDREGNRTHVKIAAIDALNPAAAMAKREARTRENEQQRSKMDDSKQIKDNPKDGSDTHDAVVDD